jgi:pimeloyl-ACP methyl ester carboxylesterase
MIWNGKPKFYKRFSLILVAFLFVTACIEVDFLLFDPEPASLKDYDFESEDLDGIPPHRILSELIPSRDAGKKLHVIYIERDEAELDPRIKPEEGISVVFSHGNSANMRMYWTRAGYFEDMGFNVLFYDYRGYGASTGKATERHIYEDVETAYDYLKTKKGVEKILSVGYSMGGAPAIWLCSPESRREVFGCFTEAAFANVDKLIDDSTGYDFEGSWFLNTVFDNRSRIKTVTRPFLIMHGKKDQRVNISNGRQLWNGVKDNNPVNRFFEIENATHRNVSIPSHKGLKELGNYSHPDEFPIDLKADFQVYKSRIVNFVVDAL